MTTPRESDHPRTPTSPGAWGAGPAERPVAADGTGGRGGARGHGTVLDRARAAAPRRGAADPVTSLLHRHRELCERAVDPLEIAAGLEAHGVTDRTAARYRHRDVFSLAEEMYARIARDTAASAPPRDDTAPRARAGWILLALLPGALCAATVAAVRLTTGPVRPAVAAVGLPALALAVHVLLRRGPLGRREHPRGGPRTPGTHAWTYWLLAYAVLGDGLLGAAVPGGPDGLPDGTRTGPWPLATVPVLALALACAPACWAAHLFAVRARRALTASRGLHEFAASVRPLLLVVFTLFLGALAALLTACGRVLHEPAAIVQTLALGALLLLARLLTAHGSTHAPAAALATAATVEATAQASVFAARLPGCDPLAVPVDTLVTAWGPGSIPALACGAAALALLIHAARTLTRASAHAQAEKQP
ncbi:hypothetical protein ACWDQO_30965 [Streptomyces sp. NPDC003703]|uniref:hypothetical protein n=1 Tax=Streptomyces sp. NPDC003283 TaxID=3364681 RepID=UPI0036BA989F